ncbi:MAG: penicillin-binding protein activator [Ignavibacteriae bacterium]|nr:penicillin-binding protein activator [Ignavibacteriota bacterium]
MNSETLKKSFSIITIILIVATLYISCTKESPKEIKIGAILPLTGVAADIGRWAKEGIDLAVADIDSANLNSKIQVKIFYDDSKLDSREGVTAFKKQVDLNKIVAVITSGSGVVLSIGPEAERLHVVQINYSAVNPQIRLAGDYTFSLVNYSDIETEEMARFVLDSLGIRQIAILYASTSYGVGTRDAMIHNFEARGGRILGMEAYSENVVDVKPILTKLKILKPPAVYLPGTIKDAATILRQSVEVGFKTRWLSYNAIEGPNLIDIAGNAAEGLIYTSSNLYDLSLTRDEEKKFYAKYKQTYGAEPTIYAATAYDAVMLVAKATAQSQVTGQAIKDYLYKVKDYYGASGIISFDSTGSVRKPVFLKTVRNGQFVVFSN